MLKFFHFQFCAYKIVDVNSQKILITLVRGNLEKSGIFAESADPLDLVGIFQFLRTT